MHSPPVLPATLNAGDSLAASLATALHTQAEGWAAELRLIGQGANHSIAGTATEAGWAFAATRTATAAWVPGAYTSVVLLSRGDERLTLAGPTLTVRPDPAAGGTTQLDLRTPAQVRLAALQAAYDAYLSTGQLMSSYTIGTRQVSFHSITELLKAIEAARRDVAAETATTGRRILVRM